MLYLDVGGDPSAYVYEPAVGHPFGANTSNGRLSIVCEGEPAGTTGFNGVGKLMSSKVTPGSACTYEGIAISCG